MTERERFHETMRFGTPDRPPYHELDCWPETYVRWHAEGYPKHADFREYFGLDRYSHVGIETDIHPVFEEEVVEETDTHVIKTDWRGVRLKLAKQSRSIPYFYEFPVTGRESFRTFARERFDPLTASRYPAAWDIRARELANRDHPVFFGNARTVGFFGPIREWVGPERLLTAFYDDPAWIHEMMETYADFIIALTSKLLQTESSPARSPWAPTR